MGQSSGMLLKHTNVLPLLQSRQSDSWPGIRTAGMMERTWALAPAGVGSNPSHDTYKWHDVERIVLLWYAVVLSSGK